LQQGAILKKKGQQKNCCPAKFACEAGHYLRHLPGVALFEPVLFSDAGASLSNLNVPRPISGAPRAQSD
jgi:hypothetical protein